MQEHLWGRAGRRRWRWISVLLALSIVAAACGGDGDTDNAAESDNDTNGTVTEGNEEAEGGRSITIALPEEPRSLGSWNAYSNDGHPILRNVQEALLNRDPDTNELVPELATSYEEVDDTTWRFELREGVTFHDGSPFNAEAAADGLNYVLSEENAFPMRQFLGPEIDAEAVDEYTLDVTTEAPDPILPLRLYFVTLPSMQALDENPDSYETNPVGTGPYVMDEWNRGQNIRLSANEEWWGRDDPDGAQGTNEAISEATFVFRPETEVRAGMVRSGEADFARWVTPEQCPEAPACESGPTVETIILRLDTPNPTLADIRVREAIALSFDKETIMQDIMGGGEVARQIVSSGALGYNENLETYPYDPERARELIEEAEADGVPIDAPLVVTAREGFIRRADEQIQLIAEGLREIGLTNVTAEMRETAAFEEQWTAGYDAIPEDRGMIGLQQHGNELMDYSISVGSYYTCGGAVSAYCDEEFDQSYEEVVQLGGDERDAALQELAAELHDRVPIVPVGHPDFFFGFSEEIGWTPRMDGFLLLKEFEFN